jgi:hypothetical protein
VVHIDMLAASDTLDDLDLTILETDEETDA